ncbi:MAG: hypothetical protein JRJ14_07195 [Deltaproteobacteria bacterium]|nr:hypothetical protein [Deltaproteobacteria bacterium]
MDVKYNVFRDIRYMSERMEHLDSELFHEFLQKIPHQLYHGKAHSSPSRVFQDEETLQHLHQYGKKYNLNLCEQNLNIF